MAKLLTFFLFLFMGIPSIFSQIRQVDIVKKEISIINKGSAYEIKASELEDEQIKITFRNDINDKIDFGEIYLKSQKDFEDLYEIILNGFNTKKDATIFVDLGASRLALFYSEMLWGNPQLQLIHSYKNALYSTKSTKMLSKKDIIKFFKKDL